VSAKEEVERAPWPKRIWAPAIIHYATSVSPSEVLDRLAKQGSGFDAPRDGNLSKIGFRFELTTRGFKLHKVGGRFLSSPPRPIAVLDAETVDTGAGTSIEGAVRLPYPYLVMFGGLWAATLSTALLPDNGMFVAALVLWGFFGSLFTLAERVDVGRSVTSFVKQLDTALDARNSMSGVAAPISSTLATQASGGQLFRTRFQAALFLGGLTAFWGSFLLLNLMLTAMGPSASHSRQLGAEEIPVIFLMVGGGLALVVSERSLSMRMTNRSIPGMWAQMRMLMPSTLAEAARTLGLNGRLVAAALYSVLLVGIAVFFTSVVGH
jgi:hypothetical protein